jgi:hypothetical protein
MEEQKTTPQIDYSDEERKYLDKLMKLAAFAREQRDDTHAEFDDMDYVTYYETNAKAAGSYMEPKRNKEDTRIVTGTTHEKENTLLSSLLNYNLEPDITAYNEDEIPEVDAGEGMELLITKGRELENYDATRILMYKELLDQGNVFVEVGWDECEKTVKKMKHLSWSEGINPNKIKWNKEIKKAYGQCRTTILSGLKVYLGNIREPLIGKQPFIFTEEIVPYTIAEKKFQNWARWKYVDNKLIHALNLGDESIDIQNWALNEIQEGSVAVQKFYDKWNNEMMLFVNGVMMLPIEFPLTEVSPSGEYPIAKGDGESLPFFAYAKSIPAKTKVDQAVLDEMLKLIILKTRKSFAPPLANNTNQIVSKKVFMPGTITDGLDGSKIVPIGDFSGVNASEFNAFQLIKSIVDEKSVSPVFSGDQTKGSQTATEIIESKKQSMMKLGLLMYGVISLEKQIAWLQLYNHLVHSTKPVDEQVDEAKKKIKNVYRQFSLEGDLENGRKGNKMVKMLGEKEEMPDSYQVMAEEEMMKKPGLETRIIYLNADELGKLRYYWKINITPTEKDTTELKKALYQDFVGKTLTIFGPQAVNMDNLKERWATLGGEDPEKFWAKQQPQNPLAAMMSGAPEQSQLGAQMTQAVNPQNLKPSLNTLART